MARYGFSPATRVFEAAGAGACLITDAWEGIELFLEPDARCWWPTTATRWREHCGASTPAQARRIGAGGAAPRARRAHLRASRRAAGGAAGRAAQRAAGRSGGMSAPSGAPPLRIVILGLTITSSWGNGHATTYRGLVRELTRARPRRPVPGARRQWYAAQPRHAEPAVRPHGALRVHARSCSTATPATCAQADLVIVGSYVPDGVEVGEWVVREARGSDGVLRHRYAGDAREAAARRVRVRHAVAGRPLRPLSVVHRRADAAPHRGGVRLADGARAVLLVRPRALLPRRRRAALGPRLHGHLQRRPATDRGAAAPGAGASLARRTLRRRRPAVPGAHRLARRTCTATCTCRRAEHRDFYNAAALHAQRHPRRHDRRRVVAERAAVRGRGMRRRRSSATAGPVSRRCSSPAARSFSPTRPPTCCAVLQQMPDAERRAMGERARARVLAEHTAAHRAEQLEGYAHAVLARAGAA